MRPAGKDDIRSALFHVFRMFYNDWMSLIRVLIVGTLAYIGLVLLQRVTGKRTLSKMNAFDLIVTVALGSALANVLLSKGVALVEGLLAFALLMGLQYAVTWLSVKSQTISRLVKSEPKMLLYKGDMLRDSMRRERVVEAEILQALRSSGIMSVSDVEAVVLEADGSFSVIPSGNGTPSSLQDVHCPSDQGQ